MNYVKLKLGGKERGAKLGIGYLRYLTQEKKMTLDEVLASLNGAQSVLELPEFIFLSIKYNDSKANNAIDYTIDDVFDWLDEAGGVKSEAWLSFLEAFVASVKTDEELGKTKPQKAGAK